MVMGCNMQVSIHVSFSCKLQDQIYIGFSCTPTLKNGSWLLYSVTNEKFIFVLLFRSFKSFSSMQSNENELSRKFCFLKAFVIARSSIYSTNKLATINDSGELTDTPTCLWRWSVLSAFHTTLPSFVIFRFSYSFIICDVVYFSELFSKASLRETFK